MYIRFNTDFNCPGKTTGLTAQIETLKAANVAISAEHEALKAATIKAQRDSEWTALKNTLRRHGSTQSMKLKPVNSLKPARLGLR